MIRDFLSLAFMAYGLHALMQIAFVADQVTGVV